MLVYSITIVECWIDYGEKNQVANKVVEVDGFLYDCVGGFIHGRDPDPELDIFLIQQGKMRCLEMDENGVEICMCKTKTKNKIR